MVKARSLFSQEYGRVLIWAMIIWQVTNIEGERMTQTLVESTNNQRVRLSGHTWLQFKQIQGAIEGNSKAGSAFM